MSKKWTRVDPAEIKVGDWVKVKHDCGEYKETTYAHVVHTDGHEIGVGPYCFYSNKGTWYIRKPKKQKPLTRPDEPPVGSLFRVERTGTTYYRWSHLRDSFNPYVSVEGSPCWSFWTAITKPGDTITELVLVEAQPTVMAMERES